MMAPHASVLVILCRHNGATCTTIVVISCRHRKQLVSPLSVGAAMMGQLTSPWWVI